MKRTAPLLAAALLTLLAAPAAHAATYNVWTCANAAGQAVGIGDWHTDPGVGDQVPADQPLFVTTTTCPNPFAFADMRAYVIPRFSVTAQGFSGWTVNAAGGTRITALDLWWSNYAPPANTTTESGGLVDVLADTTPLYTNFATGTFGYVGSPAREPRALAETVSQSFAGLAASSLSVRAYCISQCSNFNANAISASYKVYRARILVEDPTPPTGTATGLTGDMQITAATPIDVTAADVGSGVRDITLTVDGNVVQHAAPDTRCPDVDPARAGGDYEAMRPCPLTLAGTLTLTPAALRDHELHTVAVTAVDAAGQTTVLATARAIAPAPAVAPGVPFVASDTLANPDLNITAARVVNGVNGGPAVATLAFPNGRRPTAHRTVRWGSRPQVIGRVTSTTGAPITAARVWLLQTDATGMSKLSAALQTAADGTIKTTLPAHEPSRTVRLLYFPYSDSNEVVSSPQVALAVRAGVSLKAAAHRVRQGGRVRLTTRLHVPVSTPAGVIATVQLRQSGHWRTFRQVRFRPGQPVQQPIVRFRHSLPGTVYKMRLRVPVQTGLPYAAGTSRTVTVTVR